MFAEEKPAAERRELDCNYNAPCVDIVFSEIEPGKIYAREFVSTDSKLRNLEDVLKKTERAEKIHQAMLKDISEYLITNGIM